MPSSTSKRARASPLNNPIVIEEVLLQQQPSPTQVEDSILARFICIPPEPACNVKNNKGTVELTVAGDKRQFANSQDQEPDRSVVPELYSDHTDYYSGTDDNNEDGDELKTDDEEYCA
ncbi:hypothetical protein BGX27_001645 [Mortierella sp. AM989]|nr:hypothetical protein BGX27_001645 [Mortierella sp. AM989]